MYLNNFSCRVLAVNSADARYVSEKSTENGTYVEIAHGTQFKLQIRNNWNRKAQFTVKINGEDMGTFQMGARQSISLDRSAFDDAIFTAFVEGSWQDSVASETIRDQNLAGLIQVEITPEVDFSHVPVVYDSWEPPRIKVNSEPSWSQNTSLYSNSVLESYEGPQINSNIGASVNCSYSKSPEVRTNSIKRRRITGAGGQSVSSDTHNNVSVGGSGISDTKFREGTHMFLDTANTTVFSMRLVSPKKVYNAGVRPLKSSQTPPRL